MAEDEVYFYDPETGEILFERKEGESLTDYYLRQAHHKAGMAQHIRKIMFRPELDQWHRQILFFRSLEQMERAREFRRKAEAARPLS